MFPMSPLNDDLDRMVENLERGLPADPPTPEGAFGADPSHLSEAEEALKQEGVLDEEIAEETTKKE